MTIRDEQTGDDHEVDQIITATFANHPDSDQREGWIVKRLCAGNALTLSLVADKGGQIVGHIACSLVQIDGESLGWHGLGPVAVRPEWQGIGSALIHAGDERVRELGSGCCVVRLLRSGRANPASCGFRRTECHSVPHQRHHPA